MKDFRDLPHKLPPALEPKAEKVTSKTDKTRINSADKERLDFVEKDRITITIGDDKKKVILNPCHLCKLEIKSEFLIGDSPDSDKKTFVFITKETDDVTRDSGLLIILLLLSYVILRVGKQVKRSLLQ